MDPRDPGHGFGRWYHPNLTPAQQTAREQIIAQTRAKETQLEAWSASFDAAAQGGTAMPALPDFTAVFASLSAAEAASKAADAAAAAPASPATTVVPTASVAS